MVTTDDLLVLARTYADAKGITLSTLSTHVFDDGKRLAALDAGAGLTTRTMARALSWFSDRWPDGVAWPKGVERPRRAA